MTVNKWLVLVRLLLGEIPEHLEFTQQGMRKPLQAYYELTQAVREGDLTLFRSVLLLNCVYKVSSIDMTWQGLLLAFPAFQLQHKQLPLGC